MTLLLFRCHSTTSTNAVLATAVAFLLCSSPSYAQPTTTNEYADLRVNPEDPGVPETLIESQHEAAGNPRYPKSATKTNDMGAPVARGGIEVRIIGGDIVNNTKAYQFFVQLENCGASLIYEDIAISAAHCENTWAGTELPVWIGGIRSFEGIQRTVTRQIVHPLYNAFDGNLDYDYMILQLDSSALVDGEKPTGAEVVPLNLDNDVPTTGETLTAIGYGMIDETVYIPSNELREVDVHAVAQDICFDIFGVDMFVPDIMICTDGDGGGSCFGDSGGPLLTQDGKQVGVVSYGPGGCPKDKMDAVYARVSGVQRWIQQQVCLWSANPPDDCETIGTIPPTTGPGAMTINILTDEFGFETAFVLKNTLTGQVYWDIPFNNLTSNTIFVADSENLPVGNYTLEVRDAGFDGICCQYGQGYFWIRDINNGNLVYSNPGHFFDYVLVQMYIDEDGTTNFVSGSYFPEFPDPNDPNNVPNYPQQVDESWPGPEPMEPFSLAVNVKFDRYPQETTWELCYRNAVDEWDQLLQFDGSEDGIHNDMVSTQFQNLEEGWYRFIIEDSDGDGICCAYRRGWVALTGFLEVTQETGLAWGNNGEFGSGMTVYFEIDANGYIKNLASNDEMLERMIARQRKKREL